MSDASILIISNGQLSLRARNFIQYAPTGMSITVNQTDNSLAGYSIDSVIIDDPIAELTRGKDE